MPAQAQVSVSLPNATAQVGTSGQLEITVGDVTGENVLAYDFTVSYDPSVLTITGVDISGTLTPTNGTWLVAGNSPIPGQFVISAGGSAALSGAGVLIKLNADFTSLGSSPLTWTAFEFNEGGVSATTTDGNVAVLSELPVELVSFDAVLDGDDAVLRWATADETNNTGFEVQIVRPHAPGAWERVGFVEGAGTSTALNSYAFRVGDLGAGRYIFRLKQVDFDGAFEYSPEIEVTVSLPEAFSLSEIYPNPFNPQAQFTLTLKRAQHTQVEVVNMLGQRAILLHDGRLEANTAHRFTLEAGSLPSGMYFVRVAGEAETAVRSVVLLK